MKHGIIWICNTYKSIIKSSCGEPGWLSQLRVWLQPRSWSGLWDQAPYWAACWQWGAHFRFFLSDPPILSLSISLSLKNKHKKIKPPLWKSILLSWTVFQLFLGLNYITISWRNQISISGQKEKKIMRCINKVYQSISEVLKATFGFHKNYFQDF